MRTFIIVGTDLRLPAVVTVHPRGAGNVLSTIIKATAQIFDDEAPVLSVDTGNLKVDGEGVLESWKMELPISGEIILHDGEGIAVRIFETKPVVMGKAVNGDGLTVAEATAAERMTGFHRCFQMTLKSFVSELGLRREEWDNIKSSGKSNFWNEDFVQEIDDIMSEEE